MSKIQFISPDTIHRYIRKLSEVLDIEFNTNIKSIEQSDKHLIIWNPYGYLNYPTAGHKQKYELYKKYKFEGRPVYIVERGALPNTIFIDHTGFNVESDCYKEELWNHSLTEEKSIKVEQYIKELKEDDSSLEPQNYKRIDRETFLRELDINSNKKIVFVPMQIHNDTVTLLWCDWIGNVKKFQDLIRKLAQENDDLIFIIKNHPAESNFNYHMINEQENIIIADKYHYKDCIAYSDIVLTINSGVGLQAMMWEKPTIILGKSIYQFENINYKANSEKEILKLIDGAKKPDMEKVKRYIYYLRFVYYSVCFMKKLTKNSSFPSLFKKISYVDNEGKRIFHVSKTQSKTTDIYFEFTKFLSDFCILQTTCLDAVRNGELFCDKDNIYIGTNISERLINCILSCGYNYDNRNKFTKDGITIHIEPMPKQTKTMRLYGEPVQVPLPVVVYLERFYGTDWRNYTLEKEKIQTIETKNIYKDNIDIVYFFNNYGWAFEFETRNYKKYSSLNIIPRLESDIEKLNKQNTDIIVIPSAWHYSFMNKDIMEKLKNQKIKIVVQYNSHIELKHCAELADLIVSSSMFLYRELIKKFNYKNIIFLPHFVDTNYFTPRNQYNYFTIGWAGRFHDPIKRTHLLAQLPYPVKLKSDYTSNLRGKSQDDMVDFYNNLDILLILSKSEGSPYPLLEAMSCGKVVISTNVGITPLVLNEEFIIKDFTDEEILNSLINILKKLKNYPNKIINEGIRNRKYVVEHLSWNNYCYLLDDIYKNLMDDNLENIKQISQIISL